MQVLKLTTGGPGSLCVTVLQDTVAYTLRSFF